MSQLFIPIFGDPMARVEAPSDVLILPGSIPALLDLRDAGIDHMTFSAHLTPEDYHATWATASTLAWSMSLNSLAAETMELPNLTTLISYSTAFAFCQISLIGNALDQIYAQHAISEVVVERGPQQEPEVFWSHPFSDFFATVVSGWCAHNKVPVRVTEPAQFHQKPAASLQREKGRSNPFSARLQRLSRTLRLAVNIPYSWKCFVLTDTSEMVDPYVELGPNITVAPTTILRYMPPRACSVKEKADVISHTIQQTREAFAAFSWQCDTLADRLTTRLDSIAVDTVINYRKALFLHRFLNKIGINPIPLLRAPFRDDPISGAISDAFRKSGSPVTEIQHGGNYNLMVRGMLPDLMTTGLADYFFQWNDCATRESSTYGIPATSTQYVNVGTPPISLRHAGTRGPWRDTGGLKVLYAPTILSLKTIVGENAVWDVYLETLDDVLRSLDAPGLNVVVSVLDNPEWNEFLSRRRFKYLKFEVTAFMARIGEADLIIADSFGGSPVYQGLMAGKLMICYAATENIVVDATFLADLKKHVAVYEDGPTFQSAIAAFAANPVKFINDHRLTNTDVLRDLYFRADTEGRLCSRLQEITQVQATRSSRTGSPHLVTKS